MAPAGAFDVYRLLVHVGEGLRGHLAVPVELDQPDELVCGRADQGVKEDLIRTLKEETKGNMHSRVESSQIVGQNSLISAVTSAVK